MTRRMFHPRLISICTLSLLLWGAGLGERSARADRGVSSTLAIPPNDHGAAILGLKVGVDLPQDLAKNHDHYLHGTPKQ